jgi:N-dimethylarginine dimethylaminohydrolase
VGFDVIDVAAGGATQANIICLGENQVIVERSNREVMMRLASEGFRIHDLDLSEFVKGNGGPNCLIMPVERKGCAAC